MLCHSCFRVMIGLHIWQRTYFFSSGTKSKLAKKLWLNSLSNRISLNQTPWLMFALVCFVYKCNLQIQMLSVRRLTMAWSCEAKKPWLLFQLSLPPMSRVFIDSSLVLSLLSSAPPPTPPPPLSLLLLPLKRYAKVDRKRNCVSVAKNAHSWRFP